MNKEIQHRIPTLLEGLLAVLQGFVVIIATVLPTVGKVIKVVAGLLGVDVPKQLVASSIKYLQKPKDEI